MKNPYPKKLRRVPAIAAILTVILSMATGCHVKEQAPSGTTGGSAPPKKDTFTLVMLTEKRYYDRSGKLFATNTYTYDDRGLLLSYEETDHREARITNATYYTYNEHGHLTSSTQEFDQGPPRIIEHTYSYNDDGAIVSYSSCVVGEAPTPTEYLEYDEQGRFQKSMIDDGNGGRRDFVICSYGSNSKLAKIDVYPYDASLNDISKPYMIYQFSYDERGNLTSYRTTVERYTTTHKYEYDDDGNLIREEDKWEYIYIDGILCGLKFVDRTDSKRFYTLDNTGRVTKLERNDGSWIEYRYKTMELTRQQTQMSRRRYRITYESCGIEAYLDDLLYHYLPKTWQ